jgi:tRNA-uridine 2-sulfurtransferase
MMDNPPDSESKTVRALGLCSGGLDSILSALVLRDQGIHVEWITFETPFFTAEKARRAAEQTGIVLHVQDITPEYLTMIQDPPAGFGRNMNPCMDCHSLMFRKAGEVMQARGFDFLFSGEVMGQRPMSQNANSLRYVAKHSGFENFILRPLSALKLTPTPMEDQGLVDRDRLMDLYGRSRKPQMALARKYGITDYPTPAGGCLLTDPGYSRRLKDLFDHGVELTPDALHLLKYGRHMRLNPGTKIIVGRTQKDNEQILHHCDSERDAVIKTNGFPGPTVVLPGGGSREVLFLAGAVCAGYSKAPDFAPVSVQVAMAGKVQSITVLPITPREAQRFLIK